jgi:hypothetical protein
MAWDEKAILRRLNRIRAGYMQIKGDMLFSVNGIRIPRIMPFTPLPPERRVRG